MRDSPNKTTVIVLFAVIAITAVFIFGHSLQGSASSWDESNVVAALFEPLFRRVYDFAGKFVSLFGHAWALDYGVFVRKCAHFVEYFVLGVECVAVTVVLVGRPVSPYLWADLFIVLAVAVADEFVQSFAGRTSAVSDVMIDFSGGLAGILVALAVTGIAMRLRRR